MPQEYARARADMWVWGEDGHADGQSCRRAYTRSHACGHAMRMATRVTAVLVVASTNVAVSTRKVSILHHSTISPEPTRIQAGTPGWYCSPSYFRPAVTLQSPSWPCCDHRRNKPPPPLQPPPSLQPPLQIAPSFARSLLVLPAQNYYGPAATLRSRRGPLHHRRSLRLIQPAGVRTCIRTRAQACVRTYLEGGDGRAVHERAR